MGECSLGTGHLLDPEVCLNRGNMRYPKTKKVWGNFSPLLFFRDISIPKVGYILDNLGPWWCQILWHVLKYLDL